MGFGGFVDNGNHMGWARRGPKQENKGCGMLQMAEPMCVCSVTPAIVLWVVQIICGCSVARSMYGALFGFNVDQVGVDGAYRSVCFLHAIKRGTPRH